MVVVCWSEKAVKSSWVKSEARYALKSDKKLWPIYIQILNSVTKRKSNKRCSSNL